ncbi:hypothetical protein Rrhod_3204 [Rhodococcus rhodnii LMG 5362]|uniref:Condensation domain-containing protein n=1 Tax=Rhodococcus rhodnii LMG 5362 TaxID=1273125 RepID=R7WJE1_9NOCA|nr:hypothetical protein Rrhod_3204 [Rhodococcus rhodnii LMG 5362]
MVTWTATPAARDAAAAAPVDPMPPTTMQERHLRRARLAREAGEMQSPWIGVAFDFPGKPSISDITAVLEQYVRRHGTLHSWFSFEDDTRSAADRDNAVRRRVVPTEAIALEATDIGVLDTTEKVRDHVAKRFAEEASALAWPAFVFGIVEHEPDDDDPDGSFTLYHAVDHAHTDMVSILLSFAEIRTLHDARLAGTSPELPPAASYADYAAREREQASQLTMASPEVAKWLGYLSRSGGSFPQFPLDLGVEDGPKPAVGTRFELADGEQCLAFGRRCKELGSGFAGGIFAALAITELEVAGRTSYMSMTPLAVRENEYMLSQGWFINLVPVAIDIDGARSFADLAGRAQEAFTEGKSLSGVSVQQVVETVVAQADSLGSGDTASLAPPPIVSYIDARHMPHADAFVSTRATGIVGGKDTRIASMWINRVNEGVWLAFSYPDTPTAHESTSTYAHTLATVIRSVAETGDYTIARSDIPAAEEVSA